MKKILIKNRLNQKLAVSLDKSHPQAGLAFVMHGLGGSKTQKHILAIGQTFKKYKYTVVYFDTTNTIGESAGTFEKATATGYYRDLEDVIRWAKKQSWFVSPFALAGHSLGGLCVALYAEKHPKQISALAPISPVISGKLSFAAHKKFGPEIFNKWKQTGWLIRKSRSHPGLIKKLPWSHMLDRLKYDLLTKAKQLTIPVLLVVGSKDTSTPPEHVRRLYQALPGKKEFHIIKGSPHTFRNKKHLAEIKKIFSRWIKSLPENK